MRQRVRCSLEHSVLARLIVKPPSSVFLPTNPLDIHPQHLPRLSRAPTRFRHHLNGRRDPPNIAPRPPERRDRNKPHANGLASYHFLPLSPVLCFQRRERLCQAHHTPTILRDYLHRTAPQLRVCSGAMQPLPSQSALRVFGGSSSRDKSAQETHAFQAKAVAADVVCA